MSSILTMAHKGTPEEMREVIRHNDEILLHAQAPSSAPTSPSREDADIVRRRRLLAERILDFPLPEDNPSSPPEASTARRSNSHTQLRGEKRKMFELMLRASQGNIDLKVITETFQITETYANTLIKLFKKNGSLEVSQTKRGRKRIAGREQLVKVRDMMMEDNRLTDSALAEKLQNEFNLPKRPHRSTIQRMRMHHMHEIGDGQWTVKKWSTRGRDANSEANLLRREQVAVKLIGVEYKGIQPVFIDETHFEFHRQVGRAKSPAGTKAIVERSMPSVRYSAICAITKRGVEDCMLLRNQTVNADVFTAFFQNLVMKMGTRKCMFFMDNAAVHDKEKLQEIVQSKNQKLEFNAPYSPELNPIENFFGLWKSRLYGKLGNTVTEDDVFLALNEALKSIQEQEIVDIINRAMTTTSENALNHVRM